MKSRQFAMWVVAAGIIASIALLPWTFTANSFNSFNSLLTQKFVPPQQDQTARQTIALLTARDYPRIEREVDPALQDGQLDSSLKAAASYLPGQASRDMVIVGYRGSFDPSDPVTLTYELKNGNRALLTVVAFKNINHQIVMEGLRVMPLSEPLEQLNAFTLRDKDFSQYTWLFATAAIGLFVAVSAFVCAWEPQLRFRWLWIFFVCLGFVRFSMNWTTGETRIFPISVLFPGFEIQAAGPYAPWIVSFALPLGGSIFWLLRDRLIGLSHRKDPVSATSPNG